MPDSSASVTVRLENVEKTYRTGEVDVHAVRGVSLEIARGEFVALMGASGSGKSTLMNILGCLDRSTTGRYFLDGEDVSSLSRDQLADVRNRKLGFVFQSFNLLARTSALENVELPLLYTADRLSNAQLRSRQLVCKGAAITIQASFPAASSSASPLHVRSSTIRKYCWPTNQQATLIAGQALR